MVRTRGLRSSGILWAAGVLILFWGLLVFSVPVQQSAANSISYCLSVLVPSLFPFMALTGLAVNSGAGTIFGRLLGSLCRKVFRLPSACAAVILISLIGGYPAGAKGISLLLEQEKVTERQAGRMLLFCINPGVAFVVTFLGGSVLGSTHIGWLLFGAVSLASLILGAVTALWSPVPQKEPQVNHIPTSGVLVNSVTGACRSMLVMCGCILAFSCFSATLHGSGIFQYITRAIAYSGIFTPMESATIFSFLLEVTGGVGVAADFQVSAVFYAFGLAFGGLCVHLQIFSMFKRLPGKLRDFFLFRFLHGGLAALIFGMLSHWTAGAQPITLPANTLPGGLMLSGSWAGGLSLLIMCVAFLLVTGSPQSILHKT